MHPSKKDCWILCPSTRIPGKYYYFNVGTGEAAWSINEIEKGMTSRPNFAHVEKWHSFPEPESPPEENVWNYQPTFKSFHQQMLSFGQAPFSKYLPTMVEIPQPNMAWPMQMPPSMYHVKPPMTNMPMFEPTWPSFAPRFKVPDKNPFLMNPYEIPLNMTKSFTQPQNRQMFTSKSSNVNNFKSPTLNLKRTDIDMSHVKEPLVKKVRMQEPLNETFIPNNFNGAKISENTSSEDLSKPKNLTMQSKHTCNCMHSKSQEKVNSWLSKSQENLAAFTKESYSENAKQSTSLNPLHKNAGLSKSMRNPTEVACSDESSNFSLKNSFIFPLRKTDSKESDNFENLSKVEVTPLKNTKHIETGNHWDKLPLEKISQEDLRHVLLAKKKRSFSENSEAQANSGRTIKTRYTESQPAEVHPKKRVTFDLGLEDSVADVDENDLNPSELVNPEENAATEADDKEPCFVIADLDVLLTDFQLLVDYVKNEEGHSLLIPRESARAVESAGCGAGDARLAHARRLARLLAAPPHYVIVQTTENETEPSNTMDPALACCWQMMEKGYNVTFITNSAELYNSALAAEIECYTTKEVKNYIDVPKPEVSFNLTRIDCAETKNSQTNDMKSSINCENTKSGTDIPQKIMISNEDPYESTIPVKIIRKQRFGNTEMQNNFFYKDEPTKEPDIKIKFSVESLQSTHEDYLQSDDGFLDRASLISRDIEKLCLDQQFELEKQNAAAKKQNSWTKEKERSNPKNFVLQKQVTEEKESLLFKNDDATQRLYYTANKKIKNINIYNLNELMKSFTVKTRDVEDRILAKMEEYVCWFTQVMEDTLLDIFKDMPYVEQHSKAPLQNLLTSLRGYSDQRTVKELADKLYVALDSLYIPKNDGVALCLDLRPYEFMKMLGYGTLLVKCLLNRDQDNVCLQESSERLSTLALAAEGGLEHASPRAATPPRSPHSPCAPRPEFVKNQSEVLQYLQKHFPEWKSVKHTATAKCENTKENVPEPGAQEKPAPKIVRTFGKNIGLLKFSSGKNMVLNCQDDNTPAKNAKDIDGKEKSTKKQVTQKVTGPKLMKKLALECLNPPPQMKEIDVEKRDKVNKDLLNMIDKMLSCTDLSKTVTRFYDLESIVIKNNDTKLSTSSGTNPTVSKSISFDKIGKQTEKNNQITPVASTPKTTEPLDLDMLDYSDIDESVCQEQDLGSEASNENSAEPQSNAVTTSHANNASSSGKELSPTDDSRESIENIDPVLWKQGYSMIQAFLIRFSKTFNMLLEFIKSSVVALRTELTDAKRKVLYEKAVYAESLICNLINNLKGIVDRESNDETALAPFILKSGSPADSDKRIIQYKEVVTKCVEQAEILKTALRIIKNIARDDF